MAKPSQGLWKDALFPLVGGTIKSHDKGTYQEGMKNHGQNFNLL